ncbi:unnamed protein product [Clonostachys solani]|uniref:Uncharacterized protein n=1 Tax=Clonostachys solani TaxID=160281 RepID=A0A9N9ZHS0_9HYPO|nr:unnamed protein product [Clonostachys solani]
MSLVLFRHGELTIVHDTIGVVEVDAVVAVGEDVDVVVLDAGEVEGVEEPEGILEVDVVVGDAVHEEEADVPAEGGGVGDAGGGVAVPVVLGLAHVALGVDAVVEAPVDDGGDGHAVGEGLAGVLLEGLEGLEAAVGPAPDGEAVGVDVGLAGEVLGGGDVVSGLVDAELVADGDAVGAAEEAGAAGVDSDDDVAEARGDVGLEVDGEALVDLLGAGARVLVEEDGVLLLGVEVRGPALDVVHLDAVVEVEDAVLEDGELVLAGALYQCGVVLEEAVVGAGVGRGGLDGLGRGLGPAVGEEHVSGAVGEGGRVVALLLGVGQGLEVGAVEQVDRVDVALDGGFLGGDEVDEVVGDIDCRRRVVDLPLARREHDGLGAVQGGEVGEVVVPLVDDGVDVAIVRASLAGVGRDIGHLLGNLKPAAVKGVDIRRSHGARLTSVGIEQHDLDMVAYAVGFLNEGLFVTGPDNAVDDAVVVRELVTRIDAEHLVLGHVVESQLDDWVVRSGLGILDLDLLWEAALVVGSLGAAWPADEELDGILGHSGLVGAEEGDVLAVGGPPGRATARENLFLVDPVRHTVEALDATVCCDLDYFLLAVKRANVEVVIGRLGKGNGVALGAPGRQHDISVDVLGHKWLDLAACHVENKVGGGIGMSPVVDLVDAEQDLLQVGAGLGLAGHVRAAVVVESGVFHEHASTVVLARHALLKEQAVFSIGVGDPADAVDSGSPESGEDLVEGHGLARAAVICVGIVLRVAVVVVGALGDEDAEGDEPSDGEDGHADDEDTAEALVHELSGFRLGAIVICPLAGDEGAGLEIVFRLEGVLIVEVGDIDVPV